VSESDFVGKSIGIHIRHVKEVSGGDLPTDAFETGQDEPILLIDFRRIASARHFPRFSFIRVATLTLRHGHVTFLYLIAVSKYCRGACAAWPRPEDGNRANAGRELRTVNTETLQLRKRVWDISIPSKNASL